MRGTDSGLFLPMLFGMLLCCFPRVMRGMLVMPMSSMGMVRSFFVGSRLMMLRGFLMVVRRTLMVFSGFLVMGAGFFGHRLLLVIVSIL